MDTDTVDAAPSLTVEPAYASEQGDSTSKIARGFCESMADHIVYSNYGKRDQGTFRIFESRDAQPKVVGQEENNYRVYWLTKERLEHIVENHGSQNKTPRIKEKNKDTRFFEYANIIDLIEIAIISSTNIDRGFNLNDRSKQKTVFQKKLPINIGESKEEKLPSNRIQVPTLSVYGQTMNKINTAYPLYKLEAGIVND